MIRSLVLGSFLLNLALNAAGGGPHAVGQPSSALTDAVKQPAYVEAKIMADVAAVAPGRAFHLGVDFKIKRDWHIYWKHSGETGQPTEIRWTLPAGFKAGPGARSPSRWISCPRRPTPS